MLAIIGTFLGGLGLFLLAISMITDGLKLAAGGALRSILERSTSTRLRGVASGILVTGIVQSSSAVTVATIGFVNAGLLTLTQSLGIVYGANIGTTMTGWLVAAMGFEINVASFALPMVGAGMLVRLLGAASRIGAIGEALAGFGLFFIGVDFLKDAFGSFSANLDVTSLTAETGFGLLLYTGFGFLMTLVTQSSSAAIALTLTAATGGLLAIDAAGAMVIGANIGTTSTAMLAVIGATPNAKRVAAAHVVFNLVTAVVALLLLPLLLRFVALTGSILGLEDVPAIALALFHSVFNILGVALMWPLTERLARGLLERFKTTSEELGRPRYLDSNVMITPFLGLDSLRLELERIASISREYAIEAVTTMRRSKSLDDRHAALVNLIHAVEHYTAQVERQRLPDGLSVQLPVVLRINNYCDEIAGLARDLSLRGTDVDPISAGPMAQSVADFRAQVVDTLRNCNPASGSFDRDLMGERYESLRTIWHELKANLLAAASRGAIPIAGLSNALEQLRNCLRIAEQSTKVAERYLQLGAGKESDASDEEPLAPVTVTVPTESR